MSLEPVRRPEGLQPLEWVNELTVIAQGGRDIGLDEGDRFCIETPDGEDVTVKVTKVTDERSVLQRVGSGFSHYGKHSVAELSRQA